MHRSSSLLLAGALLASASAASAAPITRTYDFFATNFAASAPLASVAGQFSLTFDPALASSGSLSSLSITYPGLTFTTANSGYTYAGSVMTVGGLVSGVSTVSTASSDFVLSFIGAGSTPFSYLPLNFAYSTGTGQSWSGDFQITLATTPPPAVPEPASWAMMLGGFGLLGGAMRRRAAVVRFA